ncbi:metal-sulfur cluster assembly factor [Campylobacter canadensis]|uniref:Metal-sulfur cluster assembly factor n=1 Tax=Campylobacter canadensis TaxID=449520 RepID=A0ABS7WSE0_9BACT|nr:metal-sulfur cluster assembly factor [Campylobacter canadensis]MBZ7987676.1 metal-sulfur cluster assembly factor [Campylobacter canadensis]MBZ7995001.1 metal-sulfur cluster assembly factor [Campylobacter canadensis]MBZ7996943.1 metal-sulfur cluster assembly factor [Campylobacter canadensis]MBZ7998787.1 metal-sulfur cluster assembly factor [Campylobacter canadensis]MBZ8000422.1 metal-sulfur cluster assembly factor [Campylobacter canadensis]
MIKKIISAINEVIDPEVGFSVVELGLIYNVEFNSGDCIVTMSLSTKSCPMHEMILDWVKNAALSVEGVNSCEINLVFEPAWEISFASDEVKKELSFF